MSDNSQPVDIEFIRHLADIIADGAVGEIEIKHDDLRIRMSRESGAKGSVTMMAPSPYPTPSPSPAPVATAQPAASPAAPAPAEGHEGGGDGDPVPSPMVGTAYMASAPGAEPYVRVGDTVSKGQTIMIVEAMKTMNQIPSPRDGTVRSICVEDGQPVEYGEPLITLD